MLCSIVQEGKEHEDFDCSDLCLPSLKEEANQIVAQKLQREKDKAESQIPGSSTTWLHNAEMLAPILTVCTSFNSVKTSLHLLIGKHKSKGRVQEISVDVIEGS